MSDSSFYKDFSPISAKQWKQKIQADLRGADYNETLVWDSPDGIRIRPFYHRDEAGREYGDIPGFPSQWTLAENITLKGHSNTASRIEDAVTRGAEALILNWEGEWPTREDWDNMAISETLKIHLAVDSDRPSIFHDAQLLKGRDPELTFLNMDVIGNLARTGNWFKDMDSDFQALRQLNSRTSCSLLAVDTSLYQNAGANRVQQLAYGLAHASEYLQLLSEDGAFNAGKPLVFKVSVNTDYFLEIAKLRALRILWAQLAADFNVNTNCHILAVPTKRNKTLYDYNVNMLRTTTECMSAALGGADTISNMPYDALFHDDNDFARRIATNQLLILKRESYFDPSVNVADGAYFIEEITADLSAKALDLFKQIEAGGGLLKQLKEGTIQRKIRESAQKEQKAFDEGALTLVGTNKYPNEKDRMKGELRVDPFPKKRADRTSIEPVQMRRLATQLEQNRLEDE